MQQTLLDEDDTQNVPESLLRYTPGRKLLRSDVRFPLSTPRRHRAPSIGCMADLAEKEKSEPLTMRVKVVEDTEIWPDGQLDPSQPLPPDPSATESVSRLSIRDLPLEVQRKVLDFIFGEVHSVNAASTTLRGKSVSSSMRHPRRKAVSDLALVSEDWRELVQERIYRHIKIKGTKAGLGESDQYFNSRMHLTKHVRHIEFWVPVWGDRTSLESSVTTLDILGYERQRGWGETVNLHPHDDNQNLLAANDLTAIFKRSVNSATLSEIFAHTSHFFSSACIFTLEGGHCKKSNMIKHFRDILFVPKHLTQLPQIRTFAMRGAWNIMRRFSDWTTIEAALPNLEEWHCAYAKPRLEAYDTINTILFYLPSRLRHVNISLDGMYSKDNTTLSSDAPAHPHLCERLGHIAPNLESLTYTGKICSCFWTAARAALKTSHGYGKSEPRLKSLELVVKSCCRQRVTTTDPDTGEPVIDELGGVMADGAGITNLPFIRAFERLTLATVQSLDKFSKLENLRIRFIDLDSPCALLNPYFQLHRNQLSGLWSEEILEVIQESVRGREGGMEYVELGEGVAEGWKKESGVGGLYPKTKPRAIKSSVYRMLAEPRGN